MIAEHDDAPYYLQRAKPRAHFWRWAMALAVGSVVSLGLLFLAGQAFDSPAPVAANTPVLMPVQRTHPSAVIDARVAPPIEPATLAPPPAQPLKQTVFNDHNYQPKPLVNVIAMPPVASTPTGDIEGNGVVTGVSEKPMACWPFQEGSIEYRDCKRAVQLNSRNR